MKAPGLSPGASLYWAPTSTRGRCMFVLTFAPYPITRDKKAERAADRRRWRKRARQEARREIVLAMEERA